MESTTSAAPFLAPPVQGRDWGWAVVVAVLSLAFHLIYFRYGVQNLVDLGVACVDSERILDGQVPGRDFFDPYGPGRFYLTALSFRIGGTSLLTFSVLCVILLTIKDLLVYFTARYFLSRPWALYIAGLAIMVHGPLHKVFLTLAAMLILHSACRFIRQPDGRRAFWMGLWVCTAGLLRLDMGAAGLLMAALLFLVMPRCSREEAQGVLASFRGFLCGLALPGIPILTYFLLAGADLGALVTHHARRVFSLEQANQDMPGALDLPFSQDPEYYLFGYLLIFLAVIYLVSLIMGISTWKRDRRQGLMLFTLLVFCALLYNQVRLGVKFSRLSQISPPLFMLFACVLQQGYRFMKTRARKWRPALLLPGAALLFFAFLTYYIWEFQGYQSQDSFAVLRLPSYFVEHPRARCYFKGKKGADVDEMIRYLETAVPPDQPIFTGASCPLFHFLSKRRNPAPFTDFTFYYFNEENQERVIQSLEDENVNVIVNWPRQLTGFWFGKSAPVLYQHLNLNYVKDRTIGRFVTLKRR